MRSKNEKGFTLVELLLYLSVSSIIITVVSVFIITLNEVRIKNQVIATVEEQGAYIAGAINQHIRSAEKVLQPLSSGSSNNELILEIMPQEKSPTRMYLKEDIMMVSEGSRGTPYPSNMLWMA
jgi:type II secretory pathway component PulJ